MTRISTWIRPLFAGMLLAAGSASFAAGGPCAADAQKLCPGIKPGGGAIANCLKEHAAELSPACKEHHEKMKQKTMAAKSACEADAAKFCKDVKPGQGRLRDCLKANEASLSAECKEHVAKAGSKKH